MLLAILLGVSATTGFAQLKWDVKAGLSLSNLTQLDGGAKPGYTIGIGADYAFNKSWSLQSGINFTGKGAKETEYEDGIKEHYKIFSHYIEVPILAAFKIPVTEDVKVVINAGPYLAAGIGGKAEYEFYTAAGEMDLFKKEKGEEKALMKRFDTGLQYGVGAELNEHFLVSLQGQCGFISPFNEPYDRWFSDDGKSPKNLSFTLSVGYRF